MSPAETLVTDLEVDGYHAWSQLYYTIVGDMSIEVELDGENKKLSMGQAANLLSNPDPNLRQDVFQKYEKAWAEKAELFASTLNHLRAFGSTLQESGLDDVLRATQRNRMERATLDAMGAVEGGKSHLVKFLKQAERLSWIKGLYDLNAPLGDAGRDSFAEAQDFVVDSLGSSVRRWPISPGLIYAG